jgi:hypothetical protein
MLKPTEAPKGQDAPERICDYCDETDPEKQAFCYARECGIVVKSPADLFTAAQARIAELEAELHNLTTAGIIEVAVRSPSVMEYMRHWEARAEQAEAEVARVINIAAGLFAGGFDNNVALIRAALREGGKDPAQKGDE